MKTRILQIFTLAVVLVFGLTLFLPLLQPAMAQAPSAESSGAFASGRILVSLKPDVDERQSRSLQERVGARFERRLLEETIEIWQVPSGRELDIVSQLSKEAMVKFAEPDYIVTAALTPNDPEIPKQWALTTINAFAAWDVATGSASIIIAIIDSGIDAGHPDLSGKIVAGYDFVGKDSIPNDEQGHGTHVAGIAAAMTNNTIGVSGIDWNARIMPVRVLDKNGSGYISGLVDGINWAVDHGADVINMSMGGSTNYSSVETAVNNAFTAGCVLIGAAGNNNSSNAFYPAAYPNVISVAATTRTDTKANYSNYGTTIDISAPGGEMSDYQDIDGIYSTLPTYATTFSNEGYFKNYDYLQGTSMAAPFVSGLAAVIWALDPTMTNTEVRSVLESTVVDLGPAGWDQSFGYGRINAQAAVYAVAPILPPDLYAINNPSHSSTYAVDWSDVTNALSYTLEEADNPDFFDAIVRYNGPATQYSVIGQAGGTYYYRVRANGASTQSNWSGTQSTGVLPAKVILSPVSNPLFLDHYTLQWAVVIGTVNYYELEEDDNAGFASPLLRYRGPALTYAVTGQAGGTWYYRLRAVNEVGNGAWSDNQSAQVTASVLAAPTLDEIANPSKLDDYTISWSTVPGASGYLLEHSKSPYFDAPEQIYSGATPFFSVIDHRAGTWYFRVRATSTTAQSAWSNSVSTLTTGWVYLPQVSQDR